MEEVLPPWAQLATWVGLVIAVVVSLFKRWLVPKSHVDELVGQLEARLDDRDERIAERDELIAELRAENRALDARNDLLSDQIRELVGLGHSTAEVVTATVVQALPPGERGGLVAGDRGGAGPKADGRAQARINKVPGRRGSRR